MNGVLSTYRIYSIKSWALTKFLDHKSGRLFEEVEVVRKQNFTSVFGSLSLSLRSISKLSGTPLVYFSFLRGTR